MKHPRPVTVDFETFGIGGRPDYPPVPVGVSIKYYGSKPRYYAWGHNTENNCSKAEAKAALVKAWGHKDGLLFHNGKFDLDVANIHFGLPIPDWSRVHDTLFLLFLDNPHSSSLGLKEAAVYILEMPADERDAVCDWLISNQPVPGVRISKSKNSPHYFGRYVALAPGKIVGAYANGDVIRTEKIFNVLWAKTLDRKMLQAYDRERQLMPILLEMERQGLAVDHRRLKSDVVMYEAWRQSIDQWIFKTLKVNDSVNLDSGEQLIRAMVGAGKVDTDLMPKTPTGKFQTNKEALLLGVTDKALLAVLKYRTQLSTCLNTFMKPWLATADASKGLIFTTWNQTRIPSGSTNAGTRTGRLSSTPNFQNIPKEFTPSFAHEEPDIKKAKKLPKCPLKGLPPLPKVRSYITPFKNEIFIDRDYCFGPDTDVLTNEGFIPFYELSDDHMVAQWNRGEITYAKPKEYQAIHFEGELIHIVGQRSTDLLVTPNHQCLLAKNHQLAFVRADEYPVGRNLRFQQPHAGAYTGRCSINPDTLRLAVAIQADATLKHGTTWAWKLKKSRKIERLVELLDRLNLEYKLTNPERLSGWSIIYLRRELVMDLDLVLDPVTKTFSRQLLELSPLLRLDFLAELSHWDGRRASENNWSYFSTHEANAMLVQEMAAITGLRTTTRSHVLPSGKTFVDVSMRTNYLTWTDTFTSTRVPYIGPVYCVTMPHGTVVVRRNGKVMVTGNSQQEPRILAHFDGGALMDKYIENPWIDFHDYAKAELEKMGKFYDRKPVKNTNLGLIYGMGAGKLAERNDMSVEESSELKKAILKLYPGLKQMYHDMRIRAKSYEPIRTWGGREYYCEPPKLIAGRIQEFDYKLVNVLIQGSAADCTKEAIIRYHATKHPDAKLVLNVHDQLTVSVPKKIYKAEMEVLRLAMESVEFDVQMLSEGAISSTNWDSLRDYDKKGVFVSS